MKRPQLGLQIEKQCYLVTSTLIAYTYIDQLALHSLDCALKVASAACSIARQHRA